MGRRVRVYRRCDQRMKPILPRSLAGQTVTVLVAGLVITHVVAIGIFAGHRANSLIRADEQHIARHITLISDIVSSVPDQWKDRIVRASDDHAFRVYITANQHGIRLWKNRRSSPGTRRFTVSPGSHRSGRAYFD